MMRQKCAILFLGAFLGSAWGCSPGGARPDFVKATAGGGSASPDRAPAVNGELAAAAGLTRLIYRVSPVDLPPHAAASNEQKESQILRFEVSEPIWIVGFEPKVVDGHGADLPSVLLNLAILSNMNDENPLCATSTSGNPFFATTSLTTSVQIPEGYGYPLLPSDPIEVRARFQNPTDKPYAGVSFEITLLAKPMNEFVALKNIRSLFIDFDPCGHAPLPVPPGDFSAHSTKATLAVGGNVVLAAGLLQDFGASVALTRGLGSAPFWKAAAELDGAHRLTALDPNPFEDPAGVPVKSGDDLTLEVVYHNTSDRWLDGAVGGAVVYFAEEE